jgi:hypothetical protein
MEPQQDFQDSISTQGSTFDPLQNPYADPMMGLLQRKNQQQYMDSVVAKWELTNDESIDIIKNRLRGREYDKKRKVWYVIEGSRPKINEHGIDNVTLMLHVLTDKNILMSNYNEQQINNAMADIMANIIHHLFTNQIDYGIATKDFAMIVTIVEESIYATYRRAFQQGERQYRKMILNLHENIVQRENAPQQQKKRGFLGALFGSKD